MSTEDGKLIKPPGHKPPDLVKVLLDQGVDLAIIKPSYKGE